MTTWVLRTGETTSWNSFFSLLMKRMMRLQELPVLKFFTSLLLKLILSWQKSSLWRKSSHWHRTNSLKLDSKLRGIWLMCVKLSLESVSWKKCSLFLKNWVRTLMTLSGCLVLSRFLRSPLRVLLKSDSKLLRICLLSCLRTKTGKLSTSLTSFWPNF